MVSNVAQLVHGPMFIGLIFNILLLGVITCQCYIYITTYKRDKTWVKIFVSATFLLNVIHTVFIIVSIYLSLVNNFGNTDRMARADWLFATEPGLTGLICSLVQFFFAWRVKILTGNIWLALIVASLALMEFGGSIASTVGVLQHPAFSEFHIFKASVLMWLIPQVLADVAITFILAGYLRKQKSGFEGSDVLIDRIIRVTVQTGLVTSACAVLDLIFFLVDTSGTHLLFNFALAKLYMNTLMSSLNGRQGWAFDSMTNSGSGKRPSTGLATNTIGGSTAFNPKKSLVRVGGVQRPEVFVQVERHELQDIESGNGRHSEIDTDKIHPSSDDISWHKGAKDD